jgi:hypothetical protein
MIHGRFYDQVLTHIGAGNVRDGVNLLAGMLDAVHGGSETMAQACTELLEHDLYRLLREDPLIGHAFANPGEPADMIELICNPVLATSLSSTGRRLYSSTSELSFVRALRQRRKIMAQRVLRAWQNNAQILIFESHLFDRVDNAEGHDLSNITVAAATDEIASDLRQKFGASLRTIVGTADATIQFAEQRGDQFDLICAVELADQRAPENLQEFVARNRSVLAVSGVLAMPSLVPHHLGSGWRAACLNWTPYCYEEPQMMQMAEHSGMTVRTYRDEMDCVVWGEFMRDDFDVSSRSNPHGD